MTIYHGSTVPIEHPEIRVGKKLIGFWHRLLYNDLV